jgi:tetratricopeptide (TPR) repeat protein
VYPSRSYRVDAIIQQHLVVCCLVLAAATLAFYNPIAHNHFIAFDDSPYILANPHVQQGLTWQTLKWAFATYDAGYWHPITWVSHALDCQLFHLNPVGHHYVNLLLHVINAILLFLLLRSATGSNAASLMVGALFALHPMNVESVAWAAERKNVLSMLFFLLALLTYNRYARTGKTSAYLSVVGLFALGLMAKPQIVTLPFVLLLWDYWPLGRLAAAHPSGSRTASRPRPFTFLVLEKLPLFALAAADSYVIVLSQHAGNAVRTATEAPWPLRLENAVVCYVRYLGKAFWPSQLAVLYPRPSSLLPFGEVAAAAAVLIFISALVIRFRARRYLVVGWLWFLGTLVPMIGIITVGEQAMADRFAYIPFVGSFIAVVWTLNEVVSDARISSAWAIAGASAVLLASGWLTNHQLHYWHDEETLWRYTLSVTENNYMAHNYLALELAKSGRSDDAITHFRAARALHQYPPDQIVKLAHYEVRLGYPGEALEECRAALRSSPPPAVKLAAYREMGRAFLDLHRYEEAEESYGEVLTRDPNDADALISSGLLALQAGDLRLAVARFSRGTNVEPKDVNFLLLAQALDRSGQPDGAREAIAQAQKLSGNLAESQHAVAQFLALANMKPL